MCLRTVNIDEARLRRISPSFKDVNVIDQWLVVVIEAALSNMEQGLTSSVPTTEEVYDAIEQSVKSGQAMDMASIQDYAIDVETMRERLHRMVHEVYSMP